MHIHPDERRYLSGVAQLAGKVLFFVCKVLLLGAISGPLLWGRVAALLMRATAAMFCPTLTLSRHLNGKKQFVL